MHLPGCPRWMWQWCHLLVLPENNRLKSVIAFHFALWSHRMTDFCSHLHYWTSPHRMTLLSQWPWSDSSLLHTGQEHCKSVCNCPDSIWSRITVPGSVPVPWLHWEQKRTGYSGSPAAYSPLTSVPETFHPDLPGIPRPAVPPPDTASYWLPVPIPEMWNMLPDRKSLP